MLNILPPLPATGLSPTRTPSETQRDVRDIFSYRLALLVMINDRDAHARLMRDFGMTLIEWRTLALIRCLEPVSMGDLTRERFQHMAQVSRTVSALVGRKLVHRTPGDADRRRQMLKLTPIGRRLYSRILRQAHQWNREVLRGLSAAELRTLMRLLDRVLGTVVNDYSGQRLSGNHKEAA